jgi:kynurenine formamidase
MAIPYPSVTDRTNPRSSRDGASPDLTPFVDARDVTDFLTSRRNWGRWGADDQLGAVNLITPAVRMAAIRLVDRGETISLSRPLDTKPAPGNPRPVVHAMERAARAGGAGVARDFIAMASHGTSTTHIDALAHVWDGDGLYGGADPDEAIRFGGSTWGGIDMWRDGIVTRGVLLDIPRTRGGAYVTRERPVTAEDLQAAADLAGVEPQAGDAIVVYCGRDLWDAEQPRYGSDASNADDSRRPGLDVSTLKFFRHYDATVLAWDMTDHRPIAFGLAYGVHAAIYAFGMVLIDSVDLTNLVARCRQLERSTFLFVAAPLYLRGGTATPINPIAIL